MKLFLRLHRFSTKSSMTFLCDIGTNNSTDVLSNYVRTMPGWILEPVAYTEKDVGVEYGRVSDLLNITS